MAKAGFVVDAEHEMNFEKVDRQRSYIKNISNKELKYYIYKIPPKRLNCIKKFNRFQNNSFPEFFFYINIQVFFVFPSY